MHCLSAAARRRVLLVLAPLMGLVLASCAGVRAQEGGGFVDLFDGRTLEGWTRRGGQATYEAKDGCIVGTTAPNQPNTFLCTKASYGDFELTLEFLVDPELNSGVQIRSESRADYQKGRVHGYQIEIDPSPRAFTGGVYDEGRRGWLADLKENPAAQRAFRQGEWNALRVVALGPEIHTWVNGVPAASLRDEMTARGFIGLQVHGVGAKAEPLTIRWRNIRLLPLGDDAAR